MSDTAVERTLADAIEVASKAEGRYIIDLTVRATGTHFRIAPARDPRQPRLWCIGVRQRTPGGVEDQTGMTWIERPGRTWAELIAVLEPLRSEVLDWLAKPDRAALCRWMLTAPPLAPISTFPGVAVPAPRRRASS